MFFQQQDANETMLAAAVSGGVTLQGCSAGVTVTSSSLVAPALVGDDSDNVGIVGTQPTTVGVRIAGYRPFAGTTCYSTPAIGGIPPGNVVTNGVTAYYPNDDGRFTKFVVANTAMIGSPSRFPTDSMNVGNVNGLALQSDGQILVGGSGGSGNGALFEFATLSDADAGVVRGTPVSPPVILANGDIVAGFRGTTGSATALEIRKYSGGAVVAVSSTNATFSTNTLAVASPVLGANDAVHFVANGGYVVVANQTNLSIRYEGQVTSSVALGAVTASPTLDCNRERPGSESGILYFATESGYLASIIVDSKGLDTTAQWPKYQRDAQNSGNVGRPMPPACP